MFLSSKTHQVAIVGITREAAGILSVLLSNRTVEVLKILNPAIEDLSSLRNLPGLTTIINMSDDLTIGERLKRLNIQGAEVIGGLSARILFSIGNPCLNGSTPWLHERPRVLESLYEIRQAVQLSKNKEELLMLFLRVAISSSGADSGSIMLTDSRKKTLTIEMADGLTADVMRSACRKIGRGVSGKVAKTGKPLLLKGPLQREEQEHARADLISSICCPLIIGSEVVGVINVNSRRKERVFDEGDLAYVKEISDLAADVIKTSKESEATSSSAFAVNVLSSAQEILGMAFSFEERLNLLLLKIINSFGGSICNYYQFLEESPSFVVVASSSFSIGLLKGKRIQLNPKIAQKVIEGKGPQSIRTPGSDSYPFKWYLAQPVWSQGRMAGLLFLHLENSKKEMREESSLLQEVGVLLGRELAKQIEMKLLKLQSAKLSAVSEASFGIASAKSLRELVDFSLPNLCLILEAEACVFSLLNPVKEQLEVFGSFGIDTSEHLCEVVQLDAFVTGRAIIPRDDVLLIRDLHEAGFAHHGSAPKSVLCKTFGRDGTVDAILSIYGKKSLDHYGSRSFTLHDKEVFLKFCLQFSKGMGMLMPYFDERN